MKNFANAEIEVVKFNNAVIATSGCTAVTGATNYNETYNEYLGSANFDLGESFDSFLADNEGYFDLTSNLILGFAD